MCFLKSSRAYAGESLRRSRTGRSARKFAARVSGASLRFLGRVGSNFSYLRGSKFGRPSSVRAIFALTASRRLVGRVSEAPRVDDPCAEAPRVFAPRASSRLNAGRSAFL
ncbi:unannotated protein [freshwater metagenome]|uniref:Unannotated protein n=1 Tax=freshwater metagenome TaxID=449393 RepID=A0A6J6E9X9_9ZZZZ